MIAAALQVQESSPAAPDTAAAAMVPPALRSDLTVSHQLFEGRSYVIVKDPLSLKYFRLGAEDFALASLFDGRRSVAAIGHEFLRAHPAAGLAQRPEDLRQRILRFANELMLEGFLEPTAASVRKRLERARSLRPRSSPWGQFMKALFLKIPIWDPDRLLIHLERRLRWIWSWQGLVVSLMVLLGGLAVFLMNIGRIAPSLNQFLTLPNLAAVWLLTIVVKVIHEFGHGLTCKHFGGEVHEMGAMVIVFSPFLYADVTDSYLFPKRRHRVLVAAAGIYIELVIAAAATLLWSIAQPGPAQQLLFNLMLITSVWTVLFNANPLMKFDGYYILTDLAAVPNLRAKAQACATDMFRRFLFGRDAPGQAPPSLLPQGRFGWFVAYSLAAQFYLLYVTLKISGLFHRLLEPYGLSWLGDWLGVGALLSMLIMPVGRFFTRQFSLRKAVHQRSPRRFWGIVLTTILAVAGLLILPWEVEVERPAVLQPLGGQYVRAEAPGRIESVAVRTGQIVHKGDVVARLSNVRISSDLKATQLKVESALRKEQLGLAGNSPNVHRQAATLVKDAAAQSREAERLAAKLELRAPNDGVVLTPDLHRLSAASLRLGDVLCEIAPIDPIRVFIPLDERQARHLQAGQRVDLRVPAFPERTFTGVILDDTKLPPSQDLPPNLVATLGGDVAAAPDARQKFVPIQTTYGVTVEFANADHELRPGMTGRARIHGQTMPLGQVLWMKILDFVSLDYRL